MSWWRELTCIALPCIQMYDMSYFLTDASGNKLEMVVKADPDDPMKASVQLLQNGNAATQLTASQKEFEGKTPEELQRMFEQKSREAVSDQTTTCESLEVDAPNRTLVSDYALTTPAGKVSVSNHDGKLRIELSPAGQPKWVYKLDAKTKKVSIEGAYDEAVHGKFLKEQFNLASDVEAAKVLTAPAAGV
jgi:hypothetical protein